ncbi:MAG: hypothetical protein Kow0063_11100 [Anaerolineae bacterium]
MPVVGAGLRPASTTKPAPTALRSHLASLPATHPLDERGLWPPQAEAIRNLEASLAQARPRALIQMATGAGKTFAAVNFTYRLIKFAGARRVLFLWTATTWAGRPSASSTSLSPPTTGANLGKLGKVRYTFGGKSITTGESP